jgi:uncharacterized membrane protein
MCDINPPSFLWVKAILYRVIRMGIVFLSSFFILGDTSVALSIMSVDVIAATFFYYFFDLWWCHIEGYIQRIYIYIKYKKLG